MRVAREQIKDGQVGVGGARFMAQHLPWRLERKTWSRCGVVEVCWSAQSWVKNLASYVGEL